MCRISKILKNESNSQQDISKYKIFYCCVVSQRYWKMKAIHNTRCNFINEVIVVSYLKDTEKWKQFTTYRLLGELWKVLCRISKILKNESNSQPYDNKKYTLFGCVVSQRYWKMKAIHNPAVLQLHWSHVVSYLKDTEKWKQFTTPPKPTLQTRELCRISKILKNESNSQRIIKGWMRYWSCVVSQRYWKMKAIHNCTRYRCGIRIVVSYLKDTEKWNPAVAKLLAGFSEKRWAKKWLS